MKCPKWLLEAMERGEGVKCWVWDDHDVKIIETVIGFEMSEGYSFLVDGRDSFMNAEPYVEEPHKFKPFDKVLVRDDKTELWGIGLFERLEDELNYPFTTMVSCFKQCIPYEGNEHLLGTSDDPKETK